MKSFFVFLLLIHYSCGKEVYDRVIYPQRQELTEGRSKKDCPLIVSGYTFLVSNLIQKSCMASCHEPGGIGESSLSFSGGDAENSQILMAYLNLSLDNFLDKATARLEHVGGTALKKEEEENFEKFFLLSEICE